MRIQSKSNDVPTNDNGKIMELNVSSIRTTPSLTPT